MHSTRIHRRLTLAGFAPAGKPSRTYGSLLPLLALFAATAIALPAQTFTTLFSFNGYDGFQPAAALVQATNGNLYGTTVVGGASGDGTVFRITPSGAPRKVLSFDKTDGQYIFVGVVQGTNGDFYGTTYLGGASSDGTVYKMTPSGELTTLHSFGGTDGDGPYAPLVQATNGNFYGTTDDGGANGSGTVFEITPGGTLTTLHSFDGTDGYMPEVLIQATNGNLYGTTLGGGASGHGTVFEITPDGMLTTLYSFCSQAGCPDGNGPGGLVQATDGNLYGTTGGGGANSDGTVFKITAAGTLTTLRSFDGTDGQGPPGGLVQAANGDFYGTTGFGGANGNYGTIFEITPGGTLTTLYSFCSQSGCADGSNPAAGLVQDTNGMFYGTTQGGGAYGFGAVFSLSVGLGPFVETQTTSGKVGAAIKILGTDLTGATSVSFNGTAAVFDVVASSLIAAKVPAGATSGKVEVVTPNGTLSSNLAFRVLP